MIKYLIKTEIDGVEIRLIYSQAPNMFYVLYGLESVPYRNVSSALDGFNECIKHALEASGEFNYLTKEY